MENYYSQQLDKVLLRSIAMEHVSRLASIYKSSRHLSFNRVSFELARVVRLAFNLIHDRARYIGA